MPPGRRTNNSPAPGGRCFLASWIKGHAGDAISSHPSAARRKPLETNGRSSSSCSRSSESGHRDLLPTILDLAGVADPESYGIGKSIVPVIRDPSQSVRDHTLFSYDDVFFLPSSTSGGHIRAIREGDWTYAVYFGLDGSGLEYELYNIKNDLDQMTNLLHDAPTHDIRQEWARLHQRLTEQLVDSANLPDDFGWPLQPAMG